MPSYRPVYPRDDAKAAELANRQAWYAQREEELMAKLKRTVDQERNNKATTNAQEIDALLDSMGIRHA